MERRRLLPGRTVTLAERLADALAAERPGATFLGGDHGDDLPPADKPLTPAAVLVAVTDRARPGVILTQRTETLRHHPGQVAFPGGRLDAGETVTQAALREADEEIALPPSAVSVAGEADAYRTVTDYLVVPVVGVIPPDLQLRPSEAEVADVFEVPLDVLLNPANHVRASGTWRGQTRPYYQIPWEGRRIWGATAAMIVNLSRRLAWSA